MRDTLGVGLGGDTHSHFLDNRTHLNTGTLAGRNALSSV